MPHSYNSDVAQRISQHYDDLSPGHRQIADLLLEKPLELASLNNVELAKRCGVSVATANRFAKAIGYSGFAEFRTAQIAAMRDLTSHADRLSAEIDVDASDGEVMRNGIIQDIENLQKIQNGLDDDLCQEATRFILNANRLFVFGSGISYFVAGLLVHGLEPYCRGDASFVGAAGGAIAARRKLVNCRPGDVFIAISVPKYATDTIELTELAKKHGATIIALTDHPTSPLARLADVTLYAETFRRLLSNSMTGLIALAGSLIASIANQSADLMEFQREIDQ